MTCEDRYIRLGIDDFEGARAIKSNIVQCPRKFGNRNVSQADPVVAPNLAGRIGKMGHPQKIREVRDAFGWRFADEMRICSIVTHAKRG